eukprot:gene31997-33924_t
MHLPNSLSTKSANANSEGCDQSLQAQDYTIPDILLPSGASAAAQIARPRSQQLDFAAAASTRNWIARPLPDKCWPNAADVSIENSTKSTEMAAASDATAEMDSLCSGAALLMVETGISGRECKARDEVSEAAVRILPLLPPPPPSCSQTPDLGDIYSCFDDVAPDPAPIHVSGPRKSGEEETQDNTAELGEAAIASLDDLHCSFEDSCFPLIALMSARGRLVTDIYPNPKSVVESRVIDPTKLAPPLDFPIAAPTDTAAVVLPKVLDPAKLPQGCAALDSPTAQPMDLAAFVLPKLLDLEDRFAACQPCQPVAYAKASQARAAGPNHSLTPGPTPSPTPPSASLPMNLSNIADMFECYGIPKELSNICLYKCYESKASDDEMNEASSQCHGDIILKTADYVQHSSRDR